MRIRRGNGGGVGRGLDEEEDKFVGDNDSEAAANSGLIMVISLLLRAQY